MERFIDKKAPGFEGTRPLGDPQSARKQGPTPSVSTTLLLGGGDPPAGWGLSAVGMEAWGPAPCRADTGRVRFRGAPHPTPGDVLFGPAACCSGQRTSEGLQGNQASLSPWRKPGRGSRSRAGSLQVGEHLWEGRTCMGRSGRAPGTFAGSPVRLCAGTLTSLCGQCWLPDGLPQAQSSHLARARANLPRWALPAAL